MTKIDVWLENGRGVFGFVQKMKEPVFVFILKSETGAINPIFENCNEVESGVYEALLYQPYDSMEFKHAGIVTIFPDDEIVHIVLSYSLGELMTSRPCAKAKNATEEEKMWREYMQAKDGRLKRHVGWGYSNAIKMINGQP